MRVISLWQPWAQFIAIGARRIETCGWPTSYRGQVAIRAARLPGGVKERAPLASPFAGAIHAGGWPPLRPNRFPRDYFIAIVRVDSRRSLERAAGGYMSNKGDRLALPDQADRSFGDCTAGRFASVSKDSRALAEPLPWRGGRRWFKTDSAAIDAYALREAVHE